MIKMCDLPRYADADMEEIKKMKEAHTVLNQVTYEPKPLYHGYTDKRLRINVTDNTIDMIDKQHPRIVRIANTMELSHIWVSEALVEEVKNHPHLELDGELEDWGFDENGNLW